MQIKQGLLAMVAMSSFLTTVHAIVPTQVVHAADENRSMIITVHCKKAWHGVLVSSPEWVVIVERHYFPHCMIPCEIDPALESLELHGITRKGNEFDIVDPAAKKVIWHVVLSDHCASDDIVNSCGYGRDFNEVITRERQLNFCNQRPECQTLCSCGAGSLELDLIEICAWAAAEWKCMQYQIENPH